MPNPSHLRMRIRPIYCNSTITVVTLTPLQVYVAPTSPLLFYFSLKCQ
jgi:hypothetical protein